MCVSEVERNGSHYSQEKRRWPRLLARPLALSPPLLSARQLTDISGSGTHGDDGGWSGGAEVEKGPAKRMGGAY